MKIHVQVALEHGTLFLHDGYSEVEIPPDTSVAPFTFTNTCICFWVPDYLNGDADVIISDTSFDDSTPPNFFRRIAAPRRSISMTDVPVNYYFIHRLKADFSDIKIWNYNEDGRKKTWLQITELDLF